MQVLNLTRLPRASKISYFSDRLLVKPVDRTKLVETLTSICGSVAGRALLVDDDDLVRRVVRQVLQPLGWQVSEAENGQVAVKSLDAARPDVIILDLMMPKMDGFEFLDE